jgi:hypothetical protein
MGIGGTKCGAETTILNTNAPLKWSIHTLNKIINPK